MENSEPLKKCEQFIGFKAELLSSWVLPMNMVVQKEGLIHDDATGFQGVNQLRKERPVQVEEDDNDIVRGCAQVRRELRIRF